MDNEKQTFEELWTKIENYIEWEKIYQTMKALDWHWQLNGEYGIPRVDTIKAHARKLLFDMYEQGHGSVATGGFTAGNDNGDLWLRFTVCDIASSDL